MSVEIADDGAVRVLVASGELDSVLVPELLPQVPAWVEGAHGVVLDLSGVEFFDSSGVRLLDRVARACGRAGAPFRAVAPRTSPARRVLEIVGMAGPTVCEDLATARAAVAD